MGHIEFGSTFSFDAASPSPFIIRQPASYASPLLFLTLLIPACLILAAPFFAFSAFAISDPYAAQKILQTQPIAALQGVLGILTWIALWSIPIHRNITKLSYSRDIQFTEKGVLVSERSFFGSGTWASNYTEYKGLSQELRSDLSGTQYELSLLHREPRKTLKLLRADRISDEDLVRFASLTQAPILNGPSDPKWPLRAKSHPVDQTAALPLAA